MTDNPTIAVIKEFLILFNTYGWPAVMFLFIMFWWFVPWIKRMITKTEKTPAPYEDTHDIAILNASDAQINTLLGQACQKSRSHWCVLWQFHDGIKTIAGIPYVKQSVTHEYNVDGVEPRGAKYQGLPIGLFADALLEINKRGYIEVITGNTPYKTIENAYKSDGVSNGMFFRVCDIANKMVGILSISYETLTVIDLDTIEAMQGFASRIAMSLGSLAASRKHAHPLRRSTDKVV